MQRPSLASTISRARRGLRSPRRIALIPLLILLVGLAATALVVVQLHRTAEARDQERFARLADERVAAIRDRLETHLALLRGAAGLFAASEDVSLADFRAYVGRLRLPEIYPGVQGLGLALLVRPGEAEALAESLRRQGLTDFRIRPEDPREVVTTIAYLEPLDRRNQAAIGFDMFTEPTRRAAMALARDSGRAAMSGKVTLVQEIDEDKQAGFLIYLPIYEGADVPASIAERRQQLIGWVYSPFRAGDLLVHALAGGEGREVDLAVYDGPDPSEAGLLYASGPGGAEGLPGAEGRAAVQRIDIAGRPWMIVVTPTAAFEAASGRGLLPYLLVGGALVSLLLAGAAWWQATTQAAAERANLTSQALARELEVLNRISNRVAAELDLGTVVQMVTDAGVDLTGARFGAFFYNVTDEAGESYMLYGLSGAEREAFDGMGMPRATEVFRPTFDGEGILRSDDITADPRYGRNAPHRGLPEGHPPVRSYLAVPVTSRSGEVLGGLFFGHERTGVFTAAAERLIQGLAGMAATAIDNARLFQAREREIEERRRAEADLARGNARMTAVLESVSDGFFALDPEWRFTIFNAAAERHFGRPRDEVIGRTIREAFPSVTGSEVEGRLREVMEGGAPATFEARLDMRPDRVVEMRVARKATGGLAVSFTDITERRAQAEAVATLAAEYAAVLGQLGEGVIVADPEGRIRFVNEAAARLHGTSQLDVGPQGPGDAYRLLTEDGRPHPPEDLPLARALRRDETVHDARWRIRRPDGSEVLAIGSARPVLGPDGRRIGAVLTIRDDTARTAAEAALRARSADLATANEEIQRVAYIISHDLRAPLVNILGFTSELEALRDEIERFYREARERVPELDAPSVQAAIETDLPEAIGFIRASSAKMDRLINAILKLSREGRRVLAPEPLHVGELVRGIAATLDRQIEEGGAEVEIGELPDLVADRLAVEQVFGNLIENAVKYLAPDRPGRIVVSGRDRGAAVEYVVEDNGRGIEPKDHERIFELFRRAGKQDKPGEGIGLANVRALVRRLGGSIGVRSEPGRGSAFIVELPKVPVSELEKVA